MQESNPTAEWTKRRVCAVCERDFTLSEHGHAGARATADALEEGTADPTFFPEVLTKCPTCSSTGSTGEAEAIAAAMEIGQEMRQTGYAPYYFYAKRLGVFTAILCVCGILLAGYMGWLRKGDYNPTGWMVFLGLVGAVGTGVSLWAHLKSSAS